MGVAVRMGMGRAMLPPQVQLACSAWGCGMGRAMLPVQLAVLAAVSHTV